MGLKIMGSTALDEMSAAEAAETLGVQLRTLNKMVRNGLIQPTRSKGKTIASYTFRSSEVTALAELRYKKLDLAAVQSIAMRAYVSARGVERRVTLLYELLGLELPALETDESGVVQLFIAAQDAAADDDLTLTAQGVRKWATIIHAIDEAYLRLIEQYTGSEEPWEPFFSLAQKLCADVPRRTFLFNKDLETAYGCLEAARRHLRAVMYFFYKEKHGGKAANKAFPEMDDRGIDAEIASFLYPA